MPGLGSRGGGLGDMLASEKLTIVRSDAAGEQRVEVYGSLQSKKAFLPIDSDVEEGDLIEKPLPTGKTKTYRVTLATYYDAPGIPSQMQHVEAVIEPVATRPAVSSRRVQLPGMHPTISKVAGTLFADRHFDKAVLAAFQAVEHEVQQRTQLSESGVFLMHKAFNGTPPLIDVTRHTGRNAQDEQEGFRFLFAGAMQALRNPRAHGSAVPDSEEEALEYLALASALMRRL
jgi:uncharacterized protein (TIGR02391 family)